MIYLQPILTKINFTCPCTLIPEKGMSIDSFGFLVPLSKDVYIQMSWNNATSYTTEVRIKVVTTENEYSYLIGVLPVLDLFDGKMYGDYTKVKGSYSLTVSEDDLSLFRDVRDEFLKANGQLNGVLNFTSLYDELGDVSDYLRDHPKEEVKRANIMTFECPTTKIDSTINVVGFLLNIWTGQTTGDNYLVSWTPETKVTAMKITDTSEYRLEMLVGKVPFLNHFRRGIKVDEAEVIKEAIDVANQNI